MVLAKLTAKRFTLNEIRPVVTSLVEFISSACQPLAIYLIGSAARNEFTEYSDLDFVIVGPSQEWVRLAKSAVYRKRPYQDIPVDFLILDKVRFNSYKDVGGMAFEAVHFGIQVFPSDESGKGQRVEP